MGRPPEEAEVRKIREAAAWRGDRPLVDVLDSWLAQGRVIGLAGTRIDDALAALYGIDYEDGSRIARAVTALEDFVDKRAALAAGGETETPATCKATSPDGERCKYKAGHDASGEPHSWTLFGFGGPR